MKHFYPVIILTTIYCAIPMLSQKNYIMLGIELTIFPIMQYFVIKYSLKKRDEYDRKNLK